MSSIHFLITFEPLDSTYDEFQTLMKSVLVDLPHVTGCQDVKILRHSEQRFTILERWDSQDDHQSHVSMLQTSGQWATIEKMLARPPQGGYVDLLGGRE